MNILKIRNELRNGKTIYDLPLRVTYYARVSTEKDEQRNSLENQIQYYTELIRSRPNWTYVAGYIDEGISGTSTKKRDSFNRMIADARAGCFDFIITKEISRFSRSTLDSIQYTQELLEHNIGVLFQNDNINTLDSDSEFRLVVMAGVAQDEVRKLSERLKFGFRQAIRNGHVLGNDRLWGYNKKDCVLTVNEEEAAVVRRIFELYANQRLGVRRISQTLYDEGVRSREGNAFNVLTIRHILCNPKYKGWYCANRSQTVDYRTKRKISLAEEEWITYPDPAIPAIVSEELWDRANTLYRLRRSQAMERQSGCDYHNRYPYSGKILCETHAASCHRQVIKNAKGERETWQCRVYRQKGKAGCSTPHLRSDDLNLIMAEIFRQVLTDRDAVIRTVLRILRASGEAPEHPAEVKHLRAEIAAIQSKKEHLLELGMDGGLTPAEFQKCSDGLKERLRLLEERLAQAASEAEKEKNAKAHAAEIRSVLEEKLSLRGEPDAKLLTAILDHVAVKRESTRDDVFLEIHLRWGAVYYAHITKAEIFLCDTRSRNTTRTQTIRRISSASAPSDSSRG